MSTVMPKPGQLWSTDKIVDAYPAWDYGPAWERLPTNIIIFVIGPTDPSRPLPTWWQVLWEERPYDINLEAFNDGRLALCQ